jgi:RNA polymerase sigma-70 factor (ECF subfamily)
MSCPYLCRGPGDRFGRLAFFFEETIVNRRVKASRNATEVMEDELAAADAAMERYANGERAAFQVIYDRLAPRLISFLRRYARDEAAVQDAAQQTFLHIHRARGTFRPGARVLPWALAIARSVLRQSWRRRPRLELVSPGPDELERLDPCAPIAEATSSVEARELAGLAAGHLERLSTARRLPYELVKLEGLSHAEAAEVMGTTVMTVKLRVHRVVVELRSLLERTERA